MQLNDTYIVYDISSHLIVKQLGKFCSLHQQVIS